MLPLKLLMCGIAGFIDRSCSLSESELESLALRMAAAIVYRGPDDAGTWADPAAGVALSHRRLSILDLSAEGHQPMVSKSGDWVIVFNGEIYNFQELRSILEAQGHVFRGHSDTEVMLAAFECWGVPDATRRFNGMFAFAVWNRRERALYLSRDRMGKKPLYYGWAGNTLLFGSELKALRVHPQFRKDIRRDVAALYLRLGYIPAPHSIYEGIWKLPPGTLLKIRESDTGSNAQPVAYWSVADAIERGLASQIQDDEQALEELDALLRSAVGLRMIADVPLGAFLSGGIDSSLVVGIMQAQSTRPVKTFSIGFHERQHDEAQYAKAVAQHLGTDHTELYVTAQQALDVVPRLSDMFDEPFADSSQIPTFLVSQLARREVTVSLSGDGGDELFAGYTAYQGNQRAWARYNSMPDLVRRGVASAITHVPPAAWNRAFRLLGPVLPNGLKRENPGARLKRFGLMLGQRSAESMYLQLTSQWEQPSELIPDTEASSPFFAHGPVLPGIVEKMQYIDSICYLPDDILVKVDRASMAVSLESRAPLLDYRVFEFAWRVPMRMKIRNGSGKWLLRELLYRYVPKDLVDRPKSGFAIPIGSWLRGPLRDWAEDLLDERRLHEVGVFRPEPVRQTWAEHVRDECDWSARLWYVLMFQLWARSSVPATRDAAHALSADYA